MFSYNHKSHGESTKLGASGRRINLRRRAFLTKVGADRTNRFPRMMAVDIHLLKVLGVRSAFER